MLKVKYSNTVFLLTPIISQCRHPHKSAGQYDMI